MPKADKKFEVMDRVQWTDEYDGISKMGYIMADLSVQYLIYPELNSNVGSCFVFKNNPTLKRSY